MIDKQQMQLLGSYLMYILTPFFLLIALYTIWSIQTDRLNTLKHDQHLIGNGLMQYQYNVQIKDRLINSHGYSCFDHLNEQLSQEIVWQCINSDESDTFQSKTFMTAQPILLSENEINHLMEWSSSCRLNKGCYETYPVIQQMRITPSIDTSFYQCELTVNVSSILS